MNPDLLADTTSEHFLVNANSETVSGWSTLLIITLIIIWIARKNPETKNFLFVALFVRSFALIIDQYLFPLPGSMMDGWSFEHKAMDFSQKYGFSIIYQLDVGSSYFLSVLMSILYTLLDTRSPMMLNAVSVGIGTGSVYLIYRLAFILWGSHAAIKAGWLAALLPSLILYSAIMMREIYVVFFITYALINCVNFINKNKIIYFIKLSFGFFIGSLFHGPIIVGLLFFLIYMFFIILKKNNYFLRFKKKNIYLLFLLPIFLLPVLAYLLGFYAIPKLGNINNLGALKNEDQKLTQSFQNIKERLIWKIGKATKGSYGLKTGAQFPSWTVPENMIEIIYLTPIRIGYFLYAPFPWDIKRSSHLMGLLDGIFYIYLSFCILRNRKALYKNPQTRFLIIILIMFLTIYSFGVGNFGTSIRHRVKFIGIFIAIAAPLIARIKLKKIK